MAKPRTRARVSASTSNAGKAAVPPERDFPKPDCSSSGASDSGSKTEPRRRRQHSPSTRADSDGKARGANESDPDTVKLRKLLALRADGWTQKQIAQEFGKDPKTIRRWERQAKRQKLIVLESLTPEEVLADFLFGNAELTWNLRRQLKAAQDAGNTLLVLRCIRELTHLSTARVAVLDRIGLFDRFAFPGLKFEEPGTARLHQAVRNVETGSYEVDVEDPDQGKKDGQEPLY